MDNFKAQVNKAEHYLCELDPSLARIIQNGPCFDPQAFNKTPFESLVHAVISQQLSLRSASAIRQRVSALLNGEANAKAFKQLCPDALKATGLSQAKADTIQRLIRFALNDNRLFEKFQQLPDQQVKQHLCEIKGIGPWTADMFLMFGLRRLDIFATGDLGLRKAVQRLLQTESLPSPSDCEQLAKKWQPYRSIAAWHLWRLVD
ncbi:hypothetical protein A9Q82_03350 [Cycloclasticus sp. 46_120_T64]|nr:hypothetical protein A9Q82_03350 [Cycloclasticus sp. 46_120_T64]